MIKRLVLGNKSFPVNIIQGPLAGISCAPFRALTWQYSQPAFSCTEMISCKTLIHHASASKKSINAKRSFQRFVAKDAQEGPVCFQLSGNNTEEIATATKIATDCGADLIDLNCGCPVKKIRSKGSGSSLLTEPTKLYKLICAMRKNTTVPISIKIRVEGNSHEKFNSDIANVVSDAGTDFLIVHGRHWTEHYETTCRYDQIQFFAAQMKIPVIGNGDINCLNSLKQMFATGCSGVMIARAGVGQPWLIRKLITEMFNEKFDTPSIKKIGSIFLSHINQLSILLDSEKFAIIQARNIAKYYARPLKNRDKFCTAINSCENLSTLNKICLDFFI